MAISVNKVILVGRVGADPEIRGRDDSFVTMSVATSETWKDRSSGERKERTQWHKVVIYNEMAAKFVSSYVKKGDQVYVEGQVETRKWEKSPGEDVYITEIVVRPFTGSVQSAPKDGASRSADRDPPPDSSGGNSGSRASGGGGGRQSYDIDDEIPF